MDETSCCVMAENSRISPKRVIRINNRSRIILAGFSILISGFCEAALADRLADGKALVMDRSKGNCITCHAIADGKLPGNLGPPLISMKARFPDASDLFGQIWNASGRNPDSRMPPFGKHGILSREEIDLIISYLYTL